MDDKPACEFSTEDVIDYDGTGATCTNTNIDSSSAGVNTAIFVGKNSKGDVVKKTVTLKKADWTALGTNCENVDGAGSIDESVPPTYVDKDGAEYKLMKNGTPTVNWKATAAVPATAKSNTGGNKGTARPSSITLAFALDDANCGNKKCDGKYTRQDFAWN